VSAAREAGRHSLLRGCVRTFRTATMQVSTSLTTRSPQDAAYLPMLAEARIATP